MTPRLLPAGSPTFLRTFLRRDRWVILWFSVGVSVLYWSQGASVDGAYRTQAEFDRAAAAMGQNAAFIAMLGPARALNSTGGQVAWQSTAFGAITIGLMAMMLIGRHTRAEEESGRDELMRAGAVGRTAPMTAALGVTMLASLIVGLSVSLTLIGYGLPVAGSAVMGAGLAVFGIAAAAVALLVAQLTPNTRTVYGITGALLGAAYAVRAFGDVAQPALSWISPIGWYQAMHGYSGERWWPVLLLLGLAGAATVAAYRVFGVRDFAAGVLPDRPGPSRAGSGLLSGVGLALHLHRGSIRGWSLGMLFGGIGYGAIGSDVKSLLGDSEFAREFLTTGGPDLVDSFYALALLMLVLIGSGFTLAALTRVRTEEASGHAESLLATGLTRGRWLTGHLVVVAVGSLVVMVSSGLGVGLGFALVTGETDAIWRYGVSILAQLPGVLVLAGATLALLGLLPRLVWLGWLVLVFCAVVLFFGETLRLPGWLLDVSPFTHLSPAPAEPLAWTATLVVAVVGAGLVLLGAAGVLRRDIGTS